jgi:segregation and condensation protein A
MAEYRVNLDIYNGPLDLLLYLIRRDEVDIYDIPISRITTQYLDYVDLLKTIDLDAAGEFMVMAATLMEIKSALLLPSQETPEGETQESGDPRLTLVHQLLEYKKYKDFARDLDESAAQQAAQYPRSQADLAKLHDELRQQQEYDLEGLQIWDLFDAFQRLMKATLAGKRLHEVIHDDTPIDVYEADILDRAQHEQPLTFASVFAGRTSRSEMVGLFLAMLELIRLKLVRVEQEQVLGPIYIFALTAESAQIAVAHAISAEINRLPSDINKDKAQTQQTDSSPAAPEKSEPPDVLENHPSA